MLKNYQMTFYNKQGKSYLKNYFLEFLKLLNGKCIRYMFSIIYISLAARNFAINNFPSNTAHMINLLELKILSINFQTFFFF